MTTTTPTSTLFERVVLGVDGRPESAVAAREAAVLAGDGVPLTVVAVAETARAAQAGWIAPLAAAQEAAEAAAAVRRAERLAGAAGSVIGGDAAPTLLKAIDGDERTLLVVAGHRRGRVPEALVRSTTSELLRDGCCSVHVARGTSWPPSGPRSIVAAVDGSDAAGRALAVAEALAERFGASLRVLVAAADDDVDAAAVVERHPYAEVDGRGPEEAIVAASERADLVVLGAHGAGGSDRAGRVADRVAHHAEASVLVVR